MDVDAPTGGSSPPPPSPDPPPPSVTDRLAALTPSERAEWRRTGDLPGASPSTSTAPAVAADSAPAPDESSTEDSPASDEDAPAPETDQPPDPTAPRRRKPANARFQELLADRARERQLRETAERRIRDLEQSLAAPRARPDVPAASSPAAPETPPDVTKFEDFTEYVKAQTAYDVRHALAAERQRVAQEQAVAQQQAEAARLTHSWDERTAAARQKYADFDAVALEAPTKIPPGSLIDAWILEPDNDDGADVLYHLQKRPQELHRILALPPFQQVRALVALTGNGNGGSADAASFRRTASHAPEPPPTLQTRGTPPDEVQQAIKHKDVAAYIAAANRRDLAARK